MADIQERTGKDGKTRYTARIRVKGYRAQTATFTRLTDARTWARKQEVDMRDGKHLPAQEAKRRTLAEAIDRYKSGPDYAGKEASTRYTQDKQLEHWKTRIGHMTLAMVTPEVIGDERDTLAKGEDRVTPKPRTAATQVRYLSALSSVLAYTVQELGWLEVNPAIKVSKPKEPRGRVRILSDAERKELLAKCKESKNEALYDFVMMALSTGARRGELHNLEWRHVDLDRRVITLDKTKNGDRRVIPLRGEAERIMAARSKIRRIDNPFVFPAPFRRGIAPRPVDFQSAWDWAVERAKLTDFKFHDLRHTAASTLAMNGATLAELAEVLGHRTLAMVKRYSHFTEGHTGDLMERLSDALFTEKKEAQG